ncbi:MAG: ParA family protein [Pseudomonadota bacterium]|jgi:chromosome partitioning protein
MKAILIANPKGGSGKTTLSTNIAGYLAAQGKTVQLLDLDRQQSASFWLSNRSESLPPIRRLGENKPGTKADWLVIDSPAGLHGKNLEHAIRLAHKIVVPVAPSLFDMHASRDFFRDLAEAKAVRKGKVSVGVVGMRMAPQTRAAVTLEQFLADMELPVLAYLREAQVYVNAAFEGKSLFDMPPHLAEREWQQWEYLCDWLGQVEADEK